jgi:hypothetical protein
MKLVTERNYVAVIETVWISLSNFTLVNQKISRTGCQINVQLQPSPQDIGTTLPPSHTTATRELIENISSLPTCNITILSEMIGNYNFICCLLWVPKRISGLQ